MFDPCYTDSENREESDDDRSQEEWKEEGERWTGGHVPKKHKSGDRTPGLEYYYHLIVISLRRVHLKY